MVPKPTPRQREYINELKLLIMSLPIIVLKGDAYIGKDFIARTFFKENKIIPVEFNICELCKSIDHRLNSQDLITYLEYLHNEAINSDHFIYMRRLDKLFEIVADYQSENRHLIYVIFREWSQRISEDVRVIITISNNIRVEMWNIWSMKISITVEDMESILKEENLSKEEIEGILRISKIQLPGQISHCLKYIRAKTDDRSQWVELYKTTLGELAGSNVDADKEVVKPVEGINLIGLELALEEISTYILNPIKLNHPEISIKRGIILAGPPGTGKTSIGRWLAHELKGKLYLIDGDNGVSGSSLITMINSAVTVASENAPSVVFIDDVDVLFQHSDTYRAFLTILDGLLNKKRDNVCIIVTVMNSKNIPASLVRGGRLEMCINIGLPSVDTVIKILDLGWIKIQRILNELKLSIKSEFNPRSIAIKMTGWNCADINRCVDDVLRLIANGSKDDVMIIFEKCIRQIRDQYKRCGPSDNYVEAEELNYVA